MSHDHPTPDDAPAERPVPVPVEEIELGDVIRHRYYEWRVTEIDHLERPAPLLDRYRLSMEQIGDTWTTVLVYWETEKVPFIRQATIAETSRYPKADDQRWD